MEDEKHPQLGRKTTGEVVLITKLREALEKINRDMPKEAIEQAIEKKLKKMIEQNPSRLEFAEKLEKLIAEYNTGARTVEDFFNMLVEFAQELNEEEKRTVKESLNEEQIAVFDLLNKEDLSEKEKKQIKKIAKDIIEKLRKENLLCLDWRKKQQARAQVKEAITDVLYDELPESYDKDLLQMKVGLVFQHVYDSYVDEDKNVYSELIVN